ncbi:uncharacterized protein SAPINGB_P000879 [Magnusiomyces paraingens]|uniref:Transmembrane protein UsgS n=1 Tax=Magnusiomyces paraingens TaxID=2606893 RepID=A0A5E8B2U6_9ASCO|nr:uncharacterized protein SAPINGB_P000879 [Saprochaete ingens]VVT45764.1 unnamed protein product [Saprochaete ingens]
MPSPIFISRPPAGFSLLAVIRGVQLTFLGAIRALRNPYLVESGYYRHVLTAIVVSVIIQLVIWIPLALLRLFFAVLKLVASEEAGVTLEAILDTLHFIQNNVLNLGPFLVTAMRYFRPEMDDMFLMSLKFVDQVYKKKHPESHREYYAPLILRPSSEKARHTGSSISLRTGSQIDEKKYTKGSIGLEKSVPKKEYARGRRGQLQKLLAQCKGAISGVSGFAKNIQSNHPFHVFVRRSLRQAAFSMALYLLSFIPTLGRVVMPIASFYSFNSVVGTPTAVAIFALGYNVPRRYAVKFLTVFWGGRSLVRELLAPYFSRLPLSRAEREQWFRAREGIMFGFGAVFYLFLKTPFVGIVAYGIAEASTAYLVTKVSEPPPPPRGSSTLVAGLSSLPTGETGDEQLQHHGLAAEDRWVQRELVWTNADKLLSGLALQSDGFGATPDIVPGAWATSTAASTATDIKLDAAQKGYRGGPSSVTPSPTHSGLATPTGGNGSSSIHTPRSRTPPGYETGLAVGSGYKSTNPFLHEVRGSPVTGTRPE